MATNIKAKFKKDETDNDGLFGATGEFVDKPYERRLVVGIVRPVRIVRDLDDGTETPTVQFDHVEVLEGDDAKEALELLAHKFEQRTGRPMPPMTLFDNTGEPEDDQEPLPGLPDPYADKGTDE